MKSLTKLALVVLTLATPAAYVILPAVAVCVASDLAGNVVAFVVRKIA
jgi:hypothetical protein